MIMSLVVNLENLQGLGAVGDRVARVIFRGNGEKRISEIFSVHCKITQGSARFRRFSSKLRRCP